MAVEVHIEDTGTVIRYTITDDDVIVDIGPTLSRDLVIQNASPGTRQVIAGSLFTDGTDGIVEFTSVAGTWDTAGISKEQVFLEFSATEAWHTDIIQRQVGCKL